MVSVNVSRKEEEDPLDKLTKLTSLGLMGAQLASGFKGKVPTDDAVTRRLNALQAAREETLQNSIFGGGAKSNFGGY